MSKVARLVGNCYQSDEYWDTIYFSLVITPELKNHIKKLQKVVKDNGVYKVCDFNYAPDFFTLDSDTEIEVDEKDQPTGEKLDSLIEGDNYQRLDYCILEVDDGSFWFEGILKHTTIHVETCRMNLDEVERAENSNTDFLNVAEW